MTRIFSAFVLVFGLVTGAFAGGDEEASYVALQQLLAGRRALIGKLRSARPPAASGRRRTYPVRGVYRPRFVESGADAGKRIHLAPAVVARQAAHRLLPRCLHRQIRR